MGRRQAGGESPPRRQGGLYQLLLLFPERAEYLEQEQYRDYRIRLDHWRELSTEFRSAFEAVYERKSAAVLLVHGSQGTGKTLFTRKLEEDFEKARFDRPDPKNLWHVLAGGDPIDVSKVERAKTTTTFRRVSPQVGWLETHRKFASQDTHPMRVFVLDDFHKDAYLRELAGLIQIEYLRLKADGKEPIVLQSVAQRIVEDCRGDFARSLFVLLSNDMKLLDGLHREIELSHAGLSRQLSLPLPDAELKEEIVRTNTNRLKRSYWYCLDQGGPEEKKQAYRILTGTGGFIDSFQAIDRALGAGASKRTGRPANKNLLTLVTVAAEPIEVRSFVEEAELNASDVYVGEHVGAWLFRETWATAFGTDEGESYSRRASLVESEFALRWLSLSPGSTWLLCEAPKADALASKLVDCICYAPRIGDKASKVGASKNLSETDKEIARTVDPTKVAQFAEEFRQVGQARFRTYERALADRFGVSFSRALEVYGSLKPDVIVAEYEPCALTKSTADDPKAIESAIKRNYHVIEFTAHLQADLRGLSAYVRTKVENYASLLEDV